MRLIDAATDLLVESGPQAVTVDAVAERSGVAKSTLYRHWDSIETLMVDALRSAAPRPLPIDPSASFEDLLRQQVDEMATALANPRWMRILPALLALRAHYPEIDKLTCDDRTAKAEVLGRILDIGVAEGRIPEGIDPELVAMLLAGPMVLCAVAEDVRRVEQAGHFALERFLAGYAASTESAGEPAGK